MIQVSDASWQHTGSAWFWSILVLLIMTAVLLAITLIALRRQDIGRKAVFR